MRITKNLLKKIIFEQLLITNKFSDKTYKYNDKNIYGRNLTKLIRAAGEQQMDKFIKRSKKDPDKIGIIKFPNQNDKEFNILLDIVDFAVGLKNLIKIK